MSTESAELSHGHSPAAWTAVVIMLVAVTIGTFAFWFDLPWVVVGSAVLAVIGLIVGGIMKRAGYGVNGSKTTQKVH